MSTVDRKTLLAVMGTRFDTYSAKVVLDEALEKAGLAGRDPLAPAELATLAPVLAKLRTRMEWVATEVARLSGGGPAAAPVAAAPAAAPVPAPASAPAPAPPAPRPAAAAPAAVDVAAGAAAEASARAAAPVRITSTEAGTVRWGVNGWKAPPPGSLPVGTTPVAGETTADTPLQPTGGQPSFALVLGPLGAGVERLNFTVRFAGDRWSPPCTVKLG